MSGKITGNVFNIQGYSIHDGPGIRTNVFLNGCPLRCLWCQNPESQPAKPQLMYYSDKCTGCSSCVEVCPNGAVSIMEGKAATDRSICDGCGLCVDVCINKARSIMGKKMTVDEVCKTVMRDKPFYDTSGGGVTLSGGEPLSQPKFSAQILKTCKEKGINTAVETCGYAKWEKAESVFEYADLVLFDIKHMNSGEHKKLTGVGNEIILDNISKLSNYMKKRIIIRTPIIPGCNDSYENMTAMGEFIKVHVPTCQYVELLPYHSMGEGKNEQLEKESSFQSTVPTWEKMENLRQVIREYYIEVK